MNVILQGDYLSLPLLLIQWILERGEASNGVRDIVINEDFLLLETIDVCRLCWISKLRKMNMIWIVELIDVYLYLYNGDRFVMMRIILFNVFEINTLYNE